VTYVSDDAAHLEVARALRSGEIVTDKLFDAVYGPTTRAASKRFWTPVIVARDAANLLLQAGARRVLDVGAGVGKFAIVASLTTDLEVSGVEHRARFVSEATQAATRYGARAVFMHGSLANVDPYAYDGLYLYNPFGENLMRASKQLDATVKLGASRYARDVERVEGWLSGAPVGFSIVTYNGFGGRIPGSFALESSLPVCGCQLRLWSKVRLQCDSADFVVEHKERILDGRGSP
jgi:SAM-dependent methyltransferase